MERLDSYDKIPSGMEEYLSNYGWHFSKKMCDWAIGMMVKKDGSALTSKTKEHVDNVLATSNIKIKNDFGYDKVYVYHMGAADYLHRSVPDEVHLAMFIKDYLDDEDGYPEIAFTRFFADCSGKGIPIIWEDMI